MHVRRLTTMLGAVVCFVTVLSVALTQNASAKDKVEAKPIASNLDNPSGVAVHPVTGDVFIAARPGIYRYEAHEHKVYKEIDAASTDIYGKGPKYNVGPLGICFLSDNLLVVGDGSRKDGNEYVRVYTVGKSAAKKAQKESAAVYTLGPIKASDQTAKGEGNFYGVASDGSAIFVTCNGDDTKGWIAKSDVKKGKPGPLKLSIASKVATGVDAPVPVTFSADGKTLVVGQMGEMNVPGDSLLTMYDPKTGKLKKSLKTGLSDIAGLAYSPKTGKLYATDFSWSDTTKGGLFELSINGDKVKATKIISLDKPAGLAFDKAGNLYVAVFGTVKKGSDEAPGQVLKIAAGL